MLTRRVFPRSRLPLAAMAIASIRLSRPSPTLLPLWLPLPGTTATVPQRAANGGRYSAFDSGFDPDELKAARQWRQSFTQDALPKGNTTYSRSSGPGGQHVNKTETKAMTSWAVGELSGIVPSLLRPGLRTSRYYTKATDSFTIQAQEQRSRTANTEANRAKLYEEIVALYEAAVPGESRPETATKYKAVEKSFHEARIREKKKQSSKKQSRRGGFE